MVYPCKGAEEYIKYDIWNLKMQSNTMYSFMDIHIYKIYKEIHGNDKHQT